MERIPALQHLKIDEAYKAVLLRMNETDVLDKETWVGANKNSSTFVVSVEPGEHHVCANVQSRRGHPVGLAHFTAEAGHVYFFNARVVYGEQPPRTCFLLRSTPTKPSI
jgi:hypothetical protein